MEEQEETENLSGILSLFQGATINQIIINTTGNHSVTGYINTSTERTQSSQITPEDVASAYKACKDYTWGAASMATIFAVCRDVYQWKDNASMFERQMAAMKIDCPRGTISNAIRNNPYMRMPVGKWASQGASERVLKLADKFQSAMDAEIREKQ